MVINVGQHSLPHSSRLFSAMARGVFTTLTGERVTDSIRAESEGAGLSMGEGGAKAFYNNDPSLYSHTPLTPPPHPLPHWCPVG